MVPYHDDTAAEAIARIVFWGMMTALIQGLWGRESITDRMAATIRETLAEVEAEMPGEGGGRPEATATATEGESR